jgi:hypothetical protein
VPDTLPEVKLPVLVPVAVPASANRIEQSAGASAHNEMSMIPQWRFPLILMSSSPKE